MNDNGSAPTEFAWRRMGRDGGGGERKRLNDWAHEVNTGPCGGRLGSLSWVRHDGRATPTCMSNRQYRPRLESSRQHSLHAGLASARFLALASLRVAILPVMIACMFVLLTQRRHDRTRYDGGSDGGNDRRRMERKDQQDKREETSASGIAMLPEPISHLIRPMTASTLRALKIDDSRIILYPARSKLCRVAISKIIRTAVPHPHAIMPNLEKETNLGALASSRCIMEGEVHFDARVRKGLSVVGCGMVGNS